MQELKSSVTTLVMVAALTVGAYFLGSYKTKVELMEVSGNKVGTNAAAPQQDNGPAPEEQPVVLSDENWEKAKSGGAFTIGKEDAPITIVEFTDYQCPYCDQFVKTTYPSIKKEWIDTGKAKMIVRDLPLPFHQNAEMASVAARCAAKQGKFVEMHDTLFKNQATWGAESDPKATFGKYATQVGINTGTFNTCLSDQAILQAVKDDAALATSLGANGTPSFFIEKKLLVGAQPYESFKQALEQVQK